jgi:hypothetical protein
MLIPSCSICPQDKDIRPSRFASFKRLRSESASAYNLTAMKLTPKAPYAATLVSSRSNIPARTAVSFLICTDLAGLISQVQKHSSEVCTVTCAVTVRNHCLTLHSTDYTGRCFREPAELMISVNNLCRVQPSRLGTKQVAGRIGYMEQDLFLDIAEHRPDVSDVLANAVFQAADIAPGYEVGVYVAGALPPFLSPCAALLDRAPLLISPLKMLYS